MPKTRAHTVVLCPDEEDSLTLSSKFLEECFGMPKIPPLLLMLRHNPPPYVMSFVLENYGSSFGFVQCSLQTEVNHWNSRSIEDLPNIDAFFVSNAKAALKQKIGEILLPHAPQQMQNFPSKRDPGIIPDVSLINHLHAHPMFTHLKAILFSTPLPSEPSQIIDLAAIFDTSIIVDVHLLGSDKKVEVPPLILT